MPIPFHSSGILIADDALEVLRDWKYDFSGELRKVVLESACRERVSVISKDFVIRALRTALSEAMKKLGEPLVESRHGKAA